MLAATVRVTRDFDAAEEAVQDAYVKALSTRAEEGVPAKPGAWLTTVARRGALNALRRGRTLATKLPLLLEPDAVDPHAGADPDEIPTTACGSSSRAAIRPCPLTRRYQAALALTGNAAEQEFLEQRLSAVS